MIAFPAISLVLPRNFHGLFVADTAVFQTFKTRRTVNGFLIANPRIPPAAQSASVALFTPQHGVFLRVSVDFYDLESFLAAFECPAWSG